MRIAEIYRSTQGEGRLAGVESTFVRTSGCNLRCCFCDTPYTSWHPEGQDYSIDHLFQQVQRLQLPHVVITGGEPMLYAELIPLAARLRQAGCHITIETAGTLYLPVECQLMSISPKLSNSAPDPVRYPQWHRRHEQTRQAPNVIQRLADEYDCQFKFVIAAPDDLEEVESFLRSHPVIRRQDAQLMPEGTDLQRLATIATWLEPYCREHALNFCPRRHIEWFGHTRAS
jgi:7-carboxy-7-deazaguanine synthase